MRRLRRQSKGARVFCAGESEIILKQSGLGVKRAARPDEGLPLLRIYVYSQARADSANYFGARVRRGRNAFPRSRKRPSSAGTRSPRCAITSFTLADGAGADSRREYRLFTAAQRAG